MQQSVCSNLGCLFAQPYGVGRIVAASSRNYRNTLCCVLTAYRMHSACSSSVMVEDSPVVPQMTMASVLLLICQSISFSQFFIINGTILIHGRDDCEQPAPLNNTLFIISSPNIIIDVFNQNNPLLHTSLPLKQRLLQHPRKVLCDKQNKFVIVLTVGTQPAYRHCHSLFQIAVEFCLRPILFFKIPYELFWCQRQVHPLAAPREISPNEASSLPWSVCF